MPERHKKPLVEGQSPPQELEVGPRSGTYPQVNIIMHQERHKRAVQAAGADSGSAHPQKVIIFEVPLLLRLPKAQTHTFRDKGQDHQLSARSVGESIGQQTAEIHI